MKNNLHSACLLFLVFLFFISGFMGIVSIEPAKANTIEDYNFSKFENNTDVIWGEIGSPASDYEIWGYTDKPYKFNVNYTVLSPNNTTMVFYWDCKGDKSNYNCSSLNDTKKSEWNYSHTWNKSNTYFVCVGVFNAAPNNSCPNISYWVPIKIFNDTTIKVQNFSMVDQNYSALVDENSGDSNESNYSAYVNNDYSFFVIVNAPSRTYKTDEDKRFVNETNIVVYWDLSNNNSVNYFEDYPHNIPNDASFDHTEFDKTKLLSETKTGISWRGNYTHKWNEIGEKNISAIAYQWDLLDGSKKPSNSINKTILIIRDPKNFVSSKNSVTSFITEPFSNLQNLGIFLVSAGLMIFFFTYTKSKVPVKISLLGMKPFYLKSVDTFVGVFTFVTGMYLYLVFGRCPWDISIVRSIDWLSNVYYSMLYYEYVTHKWNSLPLLLRNNSFLFFESIPYLSILLGLVVVFVLSMIIYRIAGPFLKGDLDSGIFLRRKKVLLPRLNTLRISLLLKRK